ncbi:MAG: S8 family serine peptidase [Fimbriimonadia bacterium]|jgi:thermitase
MMLLVRLALPTYAAAFATAALASQMPMPPSGEWEPGAVLVRFSAVQPAVIAEVERHVGVTHERTLSDGRFALFKAPTDADVELLVRAAKSLPFVQDAQPNYIYRALWQPNDPSYPFQWGLPAIRWEQAMDLYRGRTDVRVAIVDTGVRSDHPDLWLNVGPGWNTIENNTNIADDNGHGTMVAGIVGAMTDNGIGIAGTAPNVRLIPLKALDQFAQGTTADVREAIQWATTNGCHVINLSLGGPVHDPAVEETCLAAWDAGAVLVGAAGNSAATWPVYPAAYEVVIDVGATSPGDLRWPWSQYNWGPDQYVDVAAPGDDILSTLSDGAYGIDSGTSYAAPFASGLAALLYGARARDLPDVPRTKAHALAVRNYIEQNADAIGEWVRFGRINAFRALLRATRATVRGSLFLPGHLDPRTILVIASLMNGTQHIESQAFNPGEGGAFDLMFQSSGQYDIRFQTPGKPFLARRLVGQNVEVGEALDGLSVSLPGGDANRDAIVDLADLTLLLVNFDKAFASLDLDGSGRVDIGDLTMVLVNFAKTADP